VLRSNGELARLDSTCTVLGLFKCWECSVKDCILGQGDILAIYTDGVTESFNAADEEFGEERLAEALQRNRDLPPKELIAALVRQVQQFSCGEQHDDITLIVARCRD